MRLFYLFIINLKIKTKGVWFGKVMDMTLCLSDKQSLLKTQIAF